MSLFGNRGEFDAFAARGDDAAQERRRQFDDASRKMADVALEEGAGLLDTFDVLPFAVIAARRTEHERLTKRYGDDHPRVIAASAAITRLTEIARWGAHGSSRAARLVEAMQLGGSAFHGFVSDPTGEPLRGVIVDVVADGVALRAARTEADGYFRVVLDGEPRSGIDLRIARRARLAAAAARKASAAPAATSAATETAATEAPATGSAAATGESNYATGRVRLLDERGRLLHDDPAALAIDRGTVYREYVIDPDDPPPASSYPRGTAAKAAKTGTKAAKPAASKKAKMAKRKPSR
jgi:hypothetical protein